MPKSQNRLINTCRYSSSRENTFEECKKKYWYLYYGSWEGWPKTPYDTRTTISPLAAYLYKQKNIQPLHVFLGTTVHRIIENTLAEYKKTKIFPDKQTLQHLTETIFDTGLRESKEERWKIHPKKYAHILEHTKTTDNLEEKERLSKEKALQCIANWIDSPITTRLLSHKDADIIGIESSHTFLLEEAIEAIAVFDLHVQWHKKNGTSTCILFDWKTGKESTHIDQQLLTYLLAAKTLFSLPIEDILIVPFYLSESPQSYKKYGHNQENSIDEMALLSMKEHAIAQAKKMLLLHPTEPTQCPDPKRFPHTDDKRKCTHCPFYPLCYTSGYLDISYQELEQICATTSCDLL